MKKTGFLRLFLLNTQLFACLFQSAPIYRRHTTSLNTSFNPRQITGDAIRQNNNAAFCDILSSVLWRRNVSQFFPIPYKSITNDFGFFPCARFMPMRVKSLHDQRKLFAGELFRQFFWKAIKDFTFCRGKKLADFQGFDRSSIHFFIFF